MPYPDCRSIYQEILRIGPSQPLLTSCIASLVHSGSILCFNPLIVCFRQPLNMLYCKKRVIPHSGQNRELPLRVSLPSRGPSLYEQLISVVAV